MAHGLGEVGVPLDELQQPVVGDGDQRVDVLGQLADALVGTGARREPSKEKGLVTTATVSAPTSWAIWAMIGVAPVPVPPPMPLVMKTMSAPSSKVEDLLVGLERRVAADLRVGSGAEAAGQLRSELQLDRRTARASAWASVLAAMNSTPERPASIIRLTELQPPPPTPMTLIRAGSGSSSR
jgi:hypothetical protein